MDEVSVSVLGYRKEGDWIAHALEMDIVGIGNTFEAAVENLSEAIDVQVSFAHFKEDSSLLFHNADPGLFVAFQLTKDMELRRQIARRHVEDNMAEFRAGGIRIPRDVEEVDFAIA